MAHKILDFFLALPAPVVVAAAFFLPALETALLLGLVVPGELVVIAAGILAGRGRVPLAPLLAASVAGAVAGDSIGYFVGRKFRDRIPARLRGRRWARACDWLRKKGPPAVFVARFTAFLRSVMPAAAGAARVRYRGFVLWDVPAGVIWGTGSVLLGYYAARQSETVIRWTGRVGLVLLAVAIVFFVRLMHRRRRGRAGRSRAGAAG